MPELPDLNIRKGALSGLFMHLIPVSSSEHLELSISVREDGFYLIESALMANGVEFQHWGPNLIDRAIWLKAVSWLKEYSSRIENATSIEEVPELKRNLEHAVEWWTLHLSDEKASISRFIREMCSWINHTIQDHQQILVRGI